MADGVTVQECVGCRARLFPTRLRCSACGSREFRPVRVTSAMVQEVTSLALATVRGGGATMIARVPTGTRAGDELRLSDDPHDVGAAFVPAG